MTLDADLQDDPAEIPRLLAKLDEGYDVVNGWKRHRHDPLHNRGVTRIQLAGQRRDGREAARPQLRPEVLRREVVHELNLFSDLHRFIPVLAAARGFRVAEVVVQHRPRSMANSKYFSRFVKALLDLLLVKFVVAPKMRPQHLLGGAGLACLGSGALAFSSLLPICALRGLPAPDLSRPT